MCHLNGASGDKPSKIGSTPFSDTPIWGMVRPLGSISPDACQPEERKACYFYNIFWGLVVYLFKRQLEKRGYVKEKRYRIEHAMLDFRLIHTVLSLTSVCRSCQFCHIRNCWLTPSMMFFGSTIPLPSHSFLWITEFCRRNMCAALTPETSLSPQYHPSATVRFSPKGRQGPDNTPPTYAEIR